jgi:hypothetical protein
MDLNGEGEAYGERGGEGVDDLLHGTGMGPCRVSLAMREGMDGGVQRWKLEA